MIDSGSSRKVRGAAKLLRDCGYVGFRKLQVGLSPKGGFIRHDGAVYVTACGVYAWTPNKLSPANQDWHKVPEDQKTAVWQDIMW